jgi:hypothetical protein
MADGNTAFNTFAMGVAATALWFWRLTCGIVGGLYLLTL